MKQFWACQPRPAKSARASLTPAWIFSAVIPGGNAGSEKSTVAGSKPTNKTRFIDPPKPRPCFAERDRITISKRQPNRVRYPPEIPGRLPVSAESGPYDLGVYL